MLRKERDSIGVFSSITRLTVPGGLNGLHAVGAEAELAGAENL